LAVDVVCFKPEVVVSGGFIKGMDLTGLIQGDLGAFMKEMTESKDAILKFVNEHWDRVIEAAVVWHIELLDLDITSFIIYGQISIDGKGHTGQKVVVIS
jgi:hypothetical protein